LDVLDFLNRVFYVLTIVGPMVVGAYILVFNRKFTETVLRQQNALWRRLPGKVQFTGRWVLLHRVFSVIVGAGLLIFGLAYAAQELAR
jgi:hypothetical protein